MRCTYLAGTESSQHGAIPTMQPGRHSFWLNCNVITYRSLHQLKMRGGRSIAPALRRAYQKHCTSDVLQASVVEKSSTLRAALGRSAARSLHATSAAQAAEKWDQQQQEDQKHEKGARSPLYAAPNVSNQVNDASRSTRAAPVLPSQLPRDFKSEADH